VGTYNLRGLNYQPSFDRGAFEAELDLYFSGKPYDFTADEAELHEASRRHPEWSLYRRKIEGYRLMAERCPVQLFRHCPFYFEVNTGRERTDLGTGGLGGWHKREPENLSLSASSAEWLKPCWESGLSVGWEVLDDNHHTLNYERVMRSGLRGIIVQAETELERAAGAQERVFLQAAIAGNQALIRIAERMAAAANDLLQREADALIRDRLQRIARTALRVPAQPAATFYEAINTIIFLFYVMPSIEGNGLSVFGHVDRLLYPYYEQDIAAGRLSPEEARHLVAYFLGICDTRFGMKAAGDRHVGTNSTITLGGCDRNGAPIFNAVTLLFLETHRDLQLVDPKVNVRLSANHPSEYFDALARFIGGGGNTLSVFNDDVVIPANVRAGKAAEDSRLYVGGGCQENVLETCEINSRATIYLNLAQVFLMGFFPQQYTTFCDRAGFVPAVFAGCASFEDFYAAFLHNLKEVVDAHITERNRTEAEGVRFNPCPLHSSMLDDCLPRQRDMMAGGCRYSAGSVSLTGMGTLIDSLFAVKIAVFDQHVLTLDTLARLLGTNFAGEDYQRLYLANRIPKFGQDGTAIRDFSARIFADAARVTSGKENTRGGRYEASLFSFRSFTDFGIKTGATPDGRCAGEYLSPGMSPSPLALRRDPSIGQVLSALESLDLTEYPVVAVLDVKLPAAQGGLPTPAIASILRRFLQAGGSVLQTNLVDQELLLDARAHPERHPDLVVRVSGYSSYFVRLDEAIQDEIIARTMLGK
jgi:pyruvate-formate lyase